MADVAVAPEVSTPAPAAPAPTAEPVASVSEHEQRYGPNGTGDPAPLPEDDGAPLDDVVDEDTHRSRPRGSRSKSKQAAAVINRLTKERGELRERLEALEKAQKSSSVPAPATPQHAFRVPSAPSGEFSTPEPKLNEFAEAEDPYGEWMLARAEWRASKREHDAMRGHQQAHVQGLTRQQEEYWRGVSDSHNQRLLEAIQKDPNVGRALSEARQRFTDAKGRSLLPPTLDTAIMLDSDGVSMAVFLASHPDVLDDAVLRAAPQPLTEETVALMRRWLRQRMTAGTTGSVAPSQSVPNTPKPPNPVRTGSIRTGAEPPGEGSSIADHARFYGPKARR